MTSASSLSLSAIGLMPPAPTAAQAAALVSVDVDLPAPPLGQLEHARNRPAAHVADRSISHDDLAGLDGQMYGTEIAAGNPHGLNPGLRRRRHQRRLLGCCCPF